MSGVFGALASHQHRLAVTVDVLAAVTLGAGAARTVPATAVFAVVDVLATVDGDLAELRSLNAEVETGVGTGVYDTHVLFELAAEAAPSRSVRATFTVPAGCRYYFTRTGTAGVGGSDLVERRVTLLTGGPE